MDENDGEAVKEDMEEVDEDVGESIGVVVPRNPAEEGDEIPAEFGIGRRRRR